MTDKLNNTIVQNSTPISQENHNTGTPINGHSVRENYVIKATEFLNTDAIKNTPMDRKVQFLRSKGLTDHEIKLALNRVLMVSGQNPSPPAPNLVPSRPHYNNSSGVMSPEYGVIQKPYESQGWFRRLFEPIAFITAIVYAGYQIYKKYVEGWLFGQRQPTLQERLQMVEISVQKCLLFLEEKSKASEEYLADMQTKRQIEQDQLRQELKSLKCLLLGRNQFPPASTTPSLPQWQQTKQSKSVDRSSKEVTEEPSTSKMLSKPTPTGSQNGPVKIESVTKESSPQVVNNVDKKSKSSSKSAKTKNTINSQNINLNGTHNEPKTTVPVSGDTANKISDTNGDKNIIDNLSNSS
ncbi:peroxisomal membrane protein PEX14 isoform X2 [Adelges cooleyi]|uniref:peroxisomal membrane protein PEX14 isoform X2 n=1 Tax=Adelges cooleyi TaxID=133065 RepID=UPI0021802EA5|nr:peroxisomal membrane protein PEX14 isoform X2 [Adelges cooleyi]